MNTGITTIRKCRPFIKEEALQRAQALGLPYFVRENMLSEMAEKYGMEGFLVYGKIQQTKNRRYNLRRPGIEI